MKCDNSTSLVVPSGRRALVVLLALGAGLLWADWPVLCAMSRKWADDPQYSHGFLVPAFAVALLWLRRGNLLLPSRFSWWGLPWLLAGAMLQWAGAYVYLDWLTAMSLLPSLAGLAVLLGGRPVLRWAWPAIAFLVFMVPLPHRLENALAGPLQHVAAQASAVVLQMLGRPALATGNVVVLNDLHLEVAAACSGLSVLLVFFALATALALLVRRPLLDRILLVLGAVPIALVVNVARIVLTGLAAEALQSKTVNPTLHALAGWLMMPLALLLLWLVNQFLRRLFLQADPVL